VREDGKRVPVK